MLGIDIILKAVVASADSKKFDAFYNNISNAIITHSDCYRFSNGIFVMDYHIDIFIYGLGFMHIYADYYSNSNLSNLTISTYKYSIVYLGEVEGSFIETYLENVIETHLDNIE